MHLTSTQQFEITKIVLDKALIGGLVLAGGYALNRLLEKFRSQQALENEKEKLRNTKRIEYLEKQLSQFYWPIYMRLHIHNAVWEKILDEGNVDDELRQRIGGEIEKNFILPNYEQVITIIQSNVYLMESDGILFGAMLQYTRHMALLKAMRAVGCDDKTPSDLGEAYPRQFLSAITTTAYQLQDEYDSLVEQVKRGI